MSKLIRFGVSLEKNLSDKFDQFINKKKYSNRSQAIRDLIRQQLVKKEWQENCVVSGAITLVYDHHKRELVNRLTDIQHNYHESILSTQHLHLDHHNCLEIIAVKGKAKMIGELFGKLKAEKGIKHTGFAQASTADKLP